MNVSPCFTEGLLSRPFGYVRQMESQQHQQQQRTNYPMQTNMDYAPTHHEPTSSYHYQQQPPNSYYHQTTYHHEQYNQYGIDGQSSGGYTQPPYPSTSYTQYSDYYHTNPTMDSEPGTSFSAPNQQQATNVGGEPGGSRYHLQYQQSTQTAVQQSMPHQHTWYQPPLMPPEHMMNMIQLTNSNGREARNRAEKNRRDKLNNSIQELSGMVPHVAESPRRVDKTAVLRFSAHGLRIDYVFGKSAGPCQFRIKPQTTDAFLRLLDSFLLTLTCRGQILLVSPSIEQHLGHCQTDLYGQSILNITHPNDHSLLKRQLVPSDLENLFDIQPGDDNLEPRPRSKEEEDEIDERLRKDRRDFTIRLARAGPRSEPTAYEVVRIDGCFRRADSAPRGTKASTFPGGLQLIRRTRGRDDSLPLHAISGNDIVLVAMARVLKPPSICDRLIEACKHEYKTRHLIDGRIVQCDQRISIVAGYLTEEVSGLSPFTFMHKDDVRWVMVALRQMYDYSRQYGESCYRLITRTGQFIYLRTRGFLEIDKETNKVHSFICINTLVSEDEGKRLVREMKKKFSIIIDPDEVAGAESEEAAVENPHQIERAIMNLITNLVPPEGLPDIPGQPDSPASTVSKDSRYTKSPPLSIIAPKPSTIKTSIVKSVSVVEAATKNIKSPESISSVSSPSSDIHRPSVLQRTPGKRGGKSEYYGSPASVGIKEETESLASPYSDQRTTPLPSSVGYFERYDLQDPEGILYGSETAQNQTFFRTEAGHRTSSVLKRTFCGEPMMESMTKRRNLMSPGGAGSSLESSIEKINNPRNDLEQVLPPTFRDIDQSLTNIGDAVDVLNEQSYLLSSSNTHQLEEIMEEQQEQRDELQSIQQEFHTIISENRNLQSSTDPHAGGSSSVVYSRVGGTGNSSSSDSGSGK
ncbi:basic helix-loop-helix ARNT-like protein 1 isoform X2 [Phlebotomus papatasi]|uniref:basic helix-loop-helix ARNT-like protein 1 isoform X2 n=1 Tax=Phlebotomus papatasi TaxID=29031 RepID=UPI0024845397|nr:basic helix-loop-helix ARNT-like protein 1 isoform X2 [Phlebotomus papatasi]